MLAVQCWPCDSLHISYNCIQLADRRQSVRSMTGRLEGKKALVYGGGTGIGFACADAMIREGAGVVISSRREAVLKEAAEKLRQHGKAGYEVGDATSTSDVRGVTAAAFLFLGGLDTIVVSAGA